MSGNLKRLGAIKMGFTSAEKKQSLTYGLHARKASAWLFVAVFVIAVAHLGQGLRGVMGWPWGRGHRGWGDVQGTQDSVPLHGALTAPSAQLHESPDSSFQQQRLSMNPQLAGSQAGES